MNMRSLIASVALCLVASAPAIAATDLQLPAFSAIEAHGGGHVVFHHGATQRVTVIKGDLKISQVTVKDGKLMVDPCPTSCWLRSQELEVEVVAPRIEALAAHGGGSIEAKGPFPSQAKLAVAAHGGGSIDARAIAAETVAASVHGGGSIRVNAIATLAAEAHGGGSITYTGNPHVASSTHGGGSISHE
jgi:hypothetical protein